MEPAASPTPRLSTPPSLQVPDESVMASFQERLGVKHVEPPPPSCAQRALPPFSPESIHGSLLREIVEQWIQRGCVPITFGVRISETRIDPVVRVVAERELIAAGFLVSSSEKGSETTKFEPSSSAVALMWSSARTRSSLSALAKIAEPSVDGSIIYKDAYAALLAVVYRFQSSTVLGIDALAKLLTWSNDGTTTWLKRALADHYLKANESRTGVVLTPQGIERLKTLNLLGRDSVPANVSPPPSMDHAEIKSKIPHIVAGLMQILPLPQGVSAREIGSALGLAEHFLRASKLLDDLVSDGVIKKTLVGVDRFHPELGRLKATTMLYQVTDPKFTADLTKVSLDRSLKLITESIQISKPSGDKYTDPNSGFSLEKMKESITEFRGGWFTQAEHRGKLAGRSLLPSDAMDLQRTLKFLVRSHFLEERATSERQFGRRKLAYRVKGAPST